MEDGLTRLVAAPPLLGNEQPGQAVMEKASRDIGLEPRDIPLDAEAIRADPFSSPFSWDVSGKRNVVATWAAGGERGGSLMLNGPAAWAPTAGVSRWTTPPFEPAPRGDWLYGR